MKLLVVLLAIGALSAIGTASLNKAKNSNVITPPSPSNSAQNSANPTSTTPTLPDYSLLDSKDEGSVQRLTILVDSTITEPEIVRINDYLISRFKEGKTHLYIDYFDDSAVADNYFSKVLSAKEAEADRLFSHYRANYLFNSVSGLNQLQVNRSGDLAVLKEY